MRSADSINTLPPLASVRTAAAFKTSCMLSDGSGKELVDKCEDLYERSEEVVEGATHELSGKYRALHEYSRQLVDEAETILRRTKSAAIGR
jgi:formate hydrogenlyase subunit 4